MLMDSLEGMWNQWLAAGDTDAYFGAFSRCYEDALRVWNGEDALPKQYCGRGTVNVLMAKGDKDFVYNYDIEEMITPLDQAERAWLAQARRLRELARLRAKLYANDTEVGHAPTCLSLIHI